jgi:DNA modification methylase
MEKVKMPKISFVKDAEEVKDILENINWAFYPQQVTSDKNRLYPFNCRKYHWYPATYIPEIPFTLIEILTAPGAKIYDPFGGIGTTYFQALLMNRIPYTTEISKVSVEFMKALFTLFNPDIDLDRTDDNINFILSNYSEKEDYISIAPVNIYLDKLTSWYSNNTMNQLAYLFIQENEIRDPTTKAAMKISISAILKTVSSQDRGWGCVADNVVPKRSQIKDKNALDSFKKHYRNLIKDIKIHLAFVMPDYRKIYQIISKEQTIFNCDARSYETIKDDSIDLIITSPPYPNMTDYITSQRLSYYYLGFELGEDKVLEIGARHKRFKKSSLEDYLTDMKNVNEVISNKLKKEGYICYVMPLFNESEQSQKGEEQSTTDRNSIIRSVMNSITEFGLKKVGEFKRTIPPKRRSHNIKWTTLEEEVIYIYKK